MVAVRRWKEGRLGSDYLMVKKSPFEMMKKLQNMIDLVVSHVNVLDATEPFTIKLLILCYVNLTTIKKKK